MSAENSVSRHPDDANEMYEKETDHDRHGVQRIEQGECIVSTVLCLSALRWALGEQALRVLLHRTATLPVCGALCGGLDLLASSTRPCCWLCPFCSMVLECMLNDSVDACPTVVP